MDFGGCLFLEDCGEGGPGAKGPGLAGGVRAGGQWLWGVVLGPGTLEKSRYGLSRPGWEFKA